MNYLGQMTANLLLLGPGSPFIYYGEELVVRGSRGAAATDANHRLAMVRDDGDTVENPTGERTAPTIGLTDFHELRVSVGSGQTSLSGSTLTIPAQTSVILK